MPRSPWCCSGLDPGRAVQVSYNRPFATRFDTPSGQDFFFNNEFPMVEFLEKNGYDVCYVSQADVAAPGGASMLADGAGQRWCVCLRLGEHLPFQHL